MQNTKTELHTHLIGMLSAKSFIKLIVECGVVGVYWPIDNPNSLQIVNINEVIRDNNMLSEMLSKLAIIEDNGGSYIETLGSYYEARSFLLKYIIEKSPLGKYEVYNKYINKCLEELIEQGIEYVEISYSNKAVLLNFEIDESIKSKITCKFLLSTDRTRPLNSFKSSAKELSKALDSGMIVGFDIMGQEIPFRDEELNPESSSSFLRKMEYIITPLMKKRMGTFRIHSGETPGSEYNTISTLGMIKQIKDKYLRENPDVNEFDILPPPEIRVGHGLYFNPSESYINMLRYFGCVIEINASSNKALGNIDNYSQLPYKYYIDNGIPVVLSTDGHGLYNTTIKKEDEQAYNEIGEEYYNYIVESDRDILSSKVGGLK